MKNDSVITHQLTAGQCDAFKVNIEKFIVHIPPEICEYKFIARVLYKGETVESVRNLSVNK